MYVLIRFLYTALQLSAANSFDWIRESLRYVPFASEINGDRERTRPPIRNHIPRQVLSRTGLPEVSSALNNDSGIQPAASFPHLYSLTKKTRASRIPQAVLSAGVLQLSTIRAR